MIGAKENTHKKHGKQPARRNDMLNAAKVTARETVSQTVNQSVGENDAAENLHEGRKRGAD